jgi:hypothetical protein
MEAIKHFLICSYGVHNTVVHKKIDALCDDHGMKSIRFECKIRHTTHTCKILYPAERHETARCLYPAVRPSGGVQRRGRDGGPAEVVKEGAVVSEV